MLRYILFIFFVLSLASCAKQEAAPIEIKTDLRRDYLSTLGLDEKSSHSKKKVVDLDYAFLSEEDDIEVQAEKNIPKGKYINEHDSYEDLNKEFKKDDTDVKELDEELSVIDPEALDNISTSNKDEIEFNDKNSNKQKEIDPVILQEAEEDSIKKSKPKKKKVFTHLITPVEGKIIVNFNDIVDGSKSLGIDIASTLGVPVVSSGSGVVILVARDSRFGNIVIVKHEDLDLQTAYAYLSSVNVSKGQYLSAGDEIGAVGKKKGTGKPVLHFAVRKSNIPVDPLKYIK